MWHHDHLLNYQGRCVRGLRQANGVHSQEEHGSAARKASLDPRTQAFPFSKKSAKLTTDTGESVRI